MKTCNSAYTDGVYVVHGGDGADQRINVSCSNMASETPITSTSGLFDTVLVLIKLTKFAVALRFLKLIFLHHFIIFR